MTVRDPQIAGVLLAYSREFASVYDRSQASSFVLFAVAPGLTHVDVESNAGSISYAVKVVE